MRPVARTPGVDALVARETGEHDGVGAALEPRRIDACGAQGGDEWRHPVAGNQTGAAAEARRQAFGGRGERSVLLADRAEPVSELAVDGGDDQPVARAGLRLQHGRGRNPCQWNAEGDGKTARRRQADTHPGEAAGADRDGDQVDRAPGDASFAQRLADRRQQPCRLLAPLLAAACQHDAVANDRHALPAHGAIEGQDGAHAREALAPLWAAGHCAVMTLDLVAIAPPAFDVDVTLAYATEANLTRQPVYRNAECWLHREAAEKLDLAISLARPLGYRLRIFDALRPVEAQWALWNACPDPDFLADPRRGSPHSRGVAVDLTLLDASGNELDMGTAFDAFTPKSHHARTDVSVVAQRNRHLLMGLMTSAGWDFYRNEWWHYQLFDARRYPLVSDADLPRPMM